MGKLQVNASCWEAEPESSTILRKESDPLSYQFAAIVDFDKSVGILSGM
jgi:hypothetical protein